jgi:hypothetical protein
MQPGDRILYIPPPGDPRPPRWGTFHAVSGQSAFVIFDHLGWLSAAPLNRLYRAESHTAGYMRILLFSCGETHDQ